MDWRVCLQYGCVHSYQEGMDTANFVYDITLKTITISKVRDSLLYIDKGYICYCHVDSMGNISGPRFINNYQIYDLSSAKEPGLSNGLSCQLSGSFSFYGDKLSYYWIEYGQAGYWFRRYKCTKSPRKKADKFFCCDIFMNTIVAPPILPSCTC